MCIQIQQSVTGAHAQLAHARTITLHPRFPGQTCMNSLGVVVPGTRAVYDAKGSKAFAETRRQR